MIKLVSAAVAATLFVTGILPITQVAAQDGGETHDFNQNSYWVQPYAGLAPPGLNDYEAASPGPISQFVPIAPFPGAGAAIGLAGPGPSDHTALCEARFRSYDPQTDLYFGFDGRYHHCNL